MKPLTRYVLIAVLAAIAGISHLLPAHAQVHGNPGTTAGTALITGGTIDNTVIGGTTPAAGTFTTVTANTKYVGGNGTAAAPVYGSTQSGGPGLYFPASNMTAISTGTGLDRFAFDGSTQRACAGCVIGFSSNGNDVSGTADDTGVSRVSAAVLAFGNGTNGDTTANLQFNKVTKYNGVATAGNGAAAVMGAGRSTAQSAAVANVLTYTTPAADGSYEVSMNVLVTTATTHTFTATITYTDEGNTSRTLTESFTLVAGGTLVTSIVNTNGTVPYMGIVQHIRVKASTSIVCATTGTFTTVTYNVECIVKQTA